MGTSKTDYFQISRITNSFAFWFYEEAQLRTRIDRVNQRKTESLSRKTTRKMFETDNRIKGLFDLSEDRFNSYGMHRWGTIENLKQGFKTLK